MRKNFLYIAKASNPYENLAIEEYMVKLAEEETLKNHSVFSLLLWQSDNAIVIGQNQNANRECNFDVVKDRNIKIVRRKTGGGAVYQDLGNLNFSFVISKDIYTKEKVFEFIIKSLSTIGINAHFSGRNDILVGEQKFSGNAFRHFKNVSLHHGTILISTDLDLAERCLTPDKFKLKKHSVTSVKSRIVNLSNIVKINVEEVINALIKTFKECSDGEIIVPSFDDKILSKMTSEFADEKWIYSKNIDDSLVIKTFQGNVRFHINEDNGKIGSCDYETDILEDDFLKDFFAGLSGVNIDKESLINYKDSIEIEQSFEMDILDLICEKIINDMVNK